MPGAGPGPLAVCSRDETGAVSPIPAAVSALGVEQLLERAGTGVGGSIRGLLRALSPASVPVPQSGLFDVDTAADLTGWRLRADRDVTRLVALIERRRGRLGERALIVALHGPAAATASLAAAVRTHLAVTVLDQHRPPSGHRVGARRPDRAGAPAAGPPATTRDPAGRAEVVLRLCTASASPAGQPPADLSVLVQPESARTPAREFATDLALLGWPGCEPS